jgi:hypothetical protein
MEWAMTPGNARYNRRRDFEDGSGSSAQIRALDHTQPVLPPRKAYPPSKILKTGTP